MVVHRAILTIPETLSRSYTVTLGRQSLPHSDTCLPFLGVLSLMFLPGLAIGFQVATTS